MSDTERVYRLLKERGARGVHTHELRTLGYSGNPSQRAADIEAKYGVEVQREREMRNGRQGSRYRIVGTGAGVLGPGQVADRGVCVDSSDSGAGQVRGERDSGRLGSSPVPASTERSVPNMFDPDVQWGS